MQVATNYAKKRLINEASNRFNLKHYDFNPNPKVIPDVLTQGEREILKRVKRRARRFDSGFKCCCFRFGIDAFIGLVPIIGDFITTLVALDLIRIACKANLPKSLISKMIINVAIDFWAGLTPLLGDILDVWFKCNTRNAKLLEEFLVQRRMDEARLERGEEKAGLFNPELSMPKLAASIKQISPIPSPFKPDLSGAQKGKYTTFFK
ncbi:hypothetical protein BD408DRAFT_215642 [Parasitella parasitica]|nr:hypothetical protein BD408DRAFT_215642 [Parasitella parasitica]